MVRRCFPVAKIVGSSPTGVVFLLLFFVFLSLFCFSGFCHDGLGVVVKTRIYRTAHLSALSSTLQKIAQHRIISTPCDDCTFYCHSVVTAFCCGQMVYAIRSLSSHITSIARVLQDLLAMPTTSKQQQYNHSYSKKVRMLETSLG